ncbi:P-loop containing nucleoside triphosphate hydrolase protein, partial [Dunaliella salina]
METLDEDEAFLEQQQLVGFGFHEIDEDILRRASHRLSAMLPRKLRFSESWALKKVQLRGNGAGRDNATFRAGSSAGPPTESGPLKVYVRLRPSSVKGVGVAADRTEEAIKATSDVGLSLEPPANAKRVLKPLPTEHFTFTKVFPGQTPQQLYFQTTTEPLVEDMLSFKWKNSVVVAYGSSGAGKTHTIEGPQDDPGLLPRAVQAIFLSLEQQQEQQANPQKRVLISFYEVYNDLVYDLLSGIAVPVALSNSTGHLQQSQPQHHSHPPSYQHLHLHQHHQQRLMGAAGNTSKATSSSSQGPAGGARNVLRVREDGSGRVCIPGLAE